MAAALGIALAGPRTYGGKTVNDPYMNATGRHAVTPDDIRRALRVYIGAIVISFVLIAATAVALTAL